MPESEETRLPTEERRGVGDAKTWVDWPRKASVEAGTGELAGWRTPTIDKWCWSSRRGLKKLSPGSQGMANLANRHRTWSFRFEEKSSRSIGGARQGRSRYLGAFNNGSVTSTRGDWSIGTTADVQRREWWGSAVEKGGGGGRARQGGTGSVEVQKTAAQHPKLERNC